MLSSTGLFGARTQPLWGVVTTALEPTPLLLSFVAYYLELGAGEVRLYLERSNPEFEAAMAKEDRVFVTVTNGEIPEKFYTKFRQPEIIIHRQRMNVSQAYAKSSCTWILHVDLDEYLINADQVIETLKELPADKLVLSIPNAERVYLRTEPRETVFDGVFRVPFVREGQERDRKSKRLLTQVYGASVKYLPRGTTAYAGWKSFFRTGSDLKIGVHQPTPRKEWRDHPARVYFEDSCLMHFDSFTERHWVNKMHRLVKRVEASNADTENRKGMLMSRKRLVETLVSFPEAAQEESVRDLFREVLTLGDDQAEMLEQMGKLVRADVDPGAAIRKRWPELSVDLSPAGIDKAMDEMRG